MVKSNVEFLPQVFLGKCSFLLISLSHLLVYFLVFIIRVNALSGIDARLTELRQLPWTGETKLWDGAIHQLVSKLSAKRRLFTVLSIL